MANEVRNVILIASIILIAIGAIVAIVDLIPDGQILSTNVGIIIGFIVGGVALLIIGFLIMRIT